jgi:hypothetical protein
VSLALLGLALLVIGVLLGFKNARGAVAVIVGVLLGVVIAGSDGALAHASHGFVDALRSWLDGLAGWIFPGGSR